MSPPIVLPINRAVTVISVSNITGIHSDKAVSIELMID
jgi:hypothetical protein